MSAVMNPPEPGSTSGLTEFVGAAAAGAAAIVFGLQKAMKMFGGARTELARDSAQLEVVNGMREELTRMNEQNGKLSDALSSLQLEIISLRSENADLHATVRSLHSEVRRLRKSGATSDFGDLHEPV